MADTAKNILYIEARTKSKEYDSETILTDLRINRLGLTAHLANMDKKIIRAERTLNDLMIAPMVDFLQVELQITSLIALQRKKDILSEKGMEFFE